jgi:uncharacterized RDD family membrane protein YckC
MDETGRGAQRSGPHVGSVGPATCASHPDAAAVARCLSCGRLLCEQCRETVNGTDYCLTHAGEAGAALAAAAAPIAWSTSDLADGWTRAIGYVADAVALSILSEIVALYILWVIPLGLHALAQFYWLTGLSMTLLAALYCTLLVGAYGRTMGHWLVGVQVIRTDGTPVSYWRAFLRWVGYVLCTALGLLGFVPAFIGPRKQGLHDLLADTVVVGSPLATSLKVRLSLVLLTILALGIVATDRVFGLFS